MGWKSHSFRAQNFSRYRLDDFQKKGIHLQRQRTWRVSADPQFAQKAADVIDLYLDPPQNAIALSIDDQSSIQALVRTSGYVLTSSNSIVRGVKSTYTRHGAVNLFAALEVTTGAAHSMITEREMRIEFLDFMD